MPAGDEDVDQSDVIAALARAPRGRRRVPHRPRDVRADAQLLAAADRRRDRRHRLPEPGREVRRLDHAGRSGVGADDDPARTAVDDITALKSAPGSDIVVTGSLTLVPALIAAGVVDEYRLFVYPVVLGRGQRLFQDATDVRKPRARRDAPVRVRHRADALPAGPSHRQPSSSSVSSPRVSPARSAARRAASSVPATYGSGVPPASWRIVSRSSGRPKTTSVETTKLGSRTEWTCVPPTVAPRASTRPVDLLERPAERGRPDVAEPLGELARGAARDVGLGRARVVDDLPLREVPRRQQRGGLAHRRGQREVAGRDDADRALAGRGVDLLVVRGGQARGADHDGDAGLDRRQRVRLDRRRATCSRSARRRRRAPRPRCRTPARRALPAERLAEVAPRRRAAHRRAQLEVGRRQHAVHERLPGPAGRARDAHLNHCHRSGIHSRPSTELLEHAEIVRRHEHLGDPSVLDPIERQLLRRHRRGCRACRCRRSARRASPRRSAGAAGPSGSRGIAPRPPAGRRRSPPGPAARR